MLVVVAVETGGTWSQEAVQFIWQLAQAKAQEFPRFLTQQWPSHGNAVLPTSSLAALLVELTSRELLYQTSGDLRPSSITSFVQD